MQCVFCLPSIILFPLCNHGRINFSPLARRRISLSGPKMTIGSNMDVVVRSIQCHQIHAHWLQWKVWLHILLLLSRELHQSVSLKSVFWSLSPLRGRRTRRSLKKSKSQKKMVRKAETSARTDDGSGHRRNWVFLLRGTPQIPAS